VSSCEDEFDGEVGRMGVLYANTRGHVDSQPLGLPRMSNAGNPPDPYSRVGL